MDRNQSFVSSINLSTENCLNDLNQTVSASVAMFNYGLYIGALTTVQNTSSSDPEYKDKQSRDNLVINRLISRNLARPLSILVEPDDGGYIARTPDLPLYGYGDDKIEAIEMLKQEIEDLYNELNEDDNFSEEWEQIKSFFNGIFFHG